VSAFAKGDVGEARRIHTSLLPSFAFETGDDAPNPVPAKAMMRVLGLPVGECRLPMGPAPAGLEDRARAVLAQMGDDAPVPVAHA
jgi:4-hydroxy-tetrahydrodipicolinate synthase